MHAMLDPEEALACILAEATVGPVRPRALTACDGLVLARDIVAPADLPRFDNSAMDGYAVRRSDLAGAAADAPVRLQLAREVFAGDDVGETTLAPGHCSLITTGAQVPPGADAVVPREKIRVAGEQIEFAETPKPAAHLRRRGEDLKKGDAVLGAGTFIGAGQVGLLASLGFAHIPVFAPPRIAILPTGSELVQPDDTGETDRSAESAPTTDLAQVAELLPGQIFESNGRMLAAQLGEDHLDCRRLSPPPDDRAALRDSLAEALRSDVVLISGGVSVGDRDYVRETLAELGVREVFWRVRVKPGKPIYFGVREARFGRGDAGDTSRPTLVFGLPGNPASTFVSFEEFVRPALRKIVGRRDLHKPSVRARLAREAKPSPDRRSYLRARLERAPSGEYTVDPHAFQGSHGLAALGAANALAILPPGPAALPAGSMLDVRVLNGLAELL